MPSRTIEMYPTYTVHVKRSIELLTHLLDWADETIWLVLEGDLSQFDDRGLIGVVRTVRGNTTYLLFRPNNRVAIPLSPGNVVHIKMSVLPRVGIRQQIRHVFLEQDGRCLFAGYDRFRNGAHFTDWVSLDSLEQLQAAGIVAIQSGFWNGNGAQANGSIGAR